MDKSKVISAWKNGKICTDSDILEMSEVCGISAKEVMHIISVEQSLGTSCEGCKHIDSRFYRPSVFPCDKCSRIYPTSDMYETE